MTENAKELVSRIVSRLGNDRSRLMDITRAVQSEVGYLSEDIIGYITEALGLHRIEIRDMASFYAFLSKEPVGKNTIRLCNAVVERMHGADEVAKAFEQALGIPFGERTSDGLFSLHFTSCIGMSDQPPSALINGQPTTELCVEDVAPLIQALKEGQKHEKIGKVKENLIQPGDVVFAYFEKGSGIRKTIDQSPEDIIKMMNRARLRGRGGAGFPLALKWDFCRKAKGENPYVICNADEGEPGTFKDRVLLSRCPDLLFEGMTIAGYAVASRQGYLYLRGEYEYLFDELNDCLEQRRRDGLLGQNILGKNGFDFDIRIQLGAGAYICGEESALIESMEGKRGAPRERPPFPVQKGFLDQPTAVNNVETLCCVSQIMNNGVEWFTQFGTKDSTGTKLLSISGDCRHPGIYEMPYGITIESMLERIGAENAQGVQVGGPSGHCIAPKDYGRGIAFEDLSTGGSVIVFGPQRDILDCMAQFLDFFQEESCGWCAPCRVGTTILVKKMQKILQGKGTHGDLDDLERLGKTVKTMSRCGLGQTAANPVLSTLQNFSDLYERRIQTDDFVPSFDLTQALRAGCEATGRKMELEHTP